MEGESLPDSGRCCEEESGTTPAPTSNRGGRRTAASLSFLLVVAVYAFLNMDKGVRRRTAVDPSQDRLDYWADIEKRSLAPAEDGNLSADPRLEIGRWKGAGGEFGLSSDWRVALTDGDDLRGRACLDPAKREQVDRILEKRNTPPERKKVAVCLRTKDYGRFLPEWIAYHYAAGVDEFSIYDDNSADNTTEVLQPFVDAGIVRYSFELIPRRTWQMKPLNHCLKYYIDAKERGDSDAPTWLMFHDGDEYVFPLDANATILETLEKHNNSCCALVPRVQYGTSGYDEMPRGLVEEVFLTHQSPNSRLANPKVMVNLDPTDKDHTVVPRLKSMHSAQGCECATQRQSGLRINHYLGSRGDYRDRLSRHWTDALEGNMSVDTRLRQRDQNDYRSDNITHWACATREILYRVDRRLDIVTGRPKDAD